MTTQGEFASSVCVGILGGLVIASLHALLEHAWFYLLKTLESKALDHTIRDANLHILFTWTVMVLHDAHCWLVPAHAPPPLQERIPEDPQAAPRQQWRTHRFGTAYGDALAIACGITTFYSLVTLWLYRSPQWNPLAILFLMWSMNNVDLMGHCGYRLPAWVYVAASLGVLLTPLTQRPRHHHLDPRFNRFLYFTW